MTPENQAKHEYLSRYRWSIKKLEEIELEITSCRLGALPGAINYDGMPKGSGNDSDLSDYIARIDELIMEFKEVRERAVTELKEISEAIEAVTDVRSNILLRYRYIMLYSWEKTAEKMGCVPEYARGTLKGEALKRFTIP